MREDPKTGMAFFSSAPYQVHNMARLRHLASLNLPIAGRVLEVGSGPGDHTGFYLERGCTMVSTDSREECLQELKARYPQVEVRVVDMNQPEVLDTLGVFDIIHCYGLLYHLEAPEPAIAAMSRVCSNLLLLETCVSPEAGRSVEPAIESLGDYTQAMSGRACRPTRAWVFDTLKKHFPFVYQTRTQPNHPEFPRDWRAIPEDHRLVRIVLVASRRPLDLPALSPVLLDVQEPLEAVTRQEVEIRDAALEDVRRRLEFANATIDAMTERNAVLEQAAADRLALVQEVERAAKERQAALEQAHQAAAELRAEIQSFRSKSLLRYALYCWKTR